MRKWSIMCLLFQILGVYNCELNDESHQDLPSTSKYLFWSVILGASLSLTKRVGPSGVWLWLTGIGLTLVESDGLSGRSWNPDPTDMSVLITFRSARCHLLLPCPHLVVTRIGSVIRDQKVPGWNPVWVGCCGVDIYQWCLTGLTKAWWCA